MIMFFVNVEHYYESKSSKLIYELAMQGKNEREIEKVINFQPEYDEDSIFNDYEYMLEDPFRLLDFVYVMMQNHIYQCERLLTSFGNWCLYDKIKPLEYRSEYTTIVRKIFDTYIYDYPRDYLINFLTVIKNYINADDLLDVYIKSKLNRKELKQLLREFNKRELYDQFVFTKQIME